MIIAPKTGLLVPMPLSSQPMPAALEVQPSDPHHTYWVRRLRSGEVRSVEKAEADKLLEAAAAAKAKAKSEAKAAEKAAAEKVAAEAKAQEDAAAKAEADKAKASSNAGGAK